MLRIGLIGLGKIGAVHARCIANHPELELGGVYARSDQSRVAFAAHYGGYPVASLDELLNAPDIDAVVIASSTDSHSDIISRAARAGMPMFCEKPVDLSMDKARAAVEIVRAAQVPVMMGFNRRYEESHAIVQQDVAAGRLGRLQVLQLTSRGPQVPPSVEYLRSSGGFFRDKGVHFFDLVRFITGDEVMEVSAMADALVHPHIREMGDFDTAIINLRMRNGALCQIDNSRTASYGYDERIEAFGSEGRVESCRSPRSHVSRAQGAAVLAAPFPQDIHERIGGSYARTMNAFADFLTGRPVQVPSIEDGLAAQRIAEAVIQSASEHRVVKMTEMDM